MNSFQDVAALIGLILTGSGLLFTGVGLFFAIKQLRVSQRVSSADFVLRFDELLIQHHNDVHTKLRPGGQWASAESGPKSVEDWVSVERYMGMFERIKGLLDDGLLDLDTIDSFWGYRIHNIVANKIIFEAKRLKTLAEWNKMPKRERERHSWRKFIELWHALEVYLDLKR